MRARIGEVESHAHLIRARGALRGMPKRDPSEASYTRALFKGALHGPVLRDRERPCKGPFERPAIGPNFGAVEEATQRRPVRGALERPREAPCKGPPREPCEGPRGLARARVAKGSPVQPFLQAHRGTCTYQKHGSCEEPVQGAFTSVRARAWGPFRGTLK